MLVHCRVKFAGTHLHTWVESGAVRVKCLAQEYNTMSPARAQAQTAQFGDEHTNHEAKVTADQVLVFDWIMGLCQVNLLNQM